MDLVSENKKTYSLENPLQTEVKHVLTAVCLLRSPEDHIVLQAILPLEKYVELCDNTARNMLYANSIIDNLVLVSTRILQISQIALKIITSFQSVVGVSEDMSQNRRHIKIFVKLLIETEDTFSKECLTFILSRIGISNIAKLLMCRVDMVNKLFSMITAFTDIDIRVNSLQVLKLIISCSDASEILTPNKVIPIEILVCLLKSPVLDIKNLATLIISILSKWSQISIHEQLRECNIVRLLFKTMQGEDWTDYHNMMLEIILGCIKRTDLGIYEMESQEFLDLIYFIKTADNDFALGVTAILTEYAKNRKARQILLDFKIPDILMDFLRRDCRLLRVKVCEAMSYMILNANCANQLVANDTFIQLLTKMMNKNTLPWDPYRQAAIKPLHDLMMKVDGVAMLFYKHNTIKPLITAVQQRKELCKSEFLLVVDIFENLLQNTVLQSYLLKEEIYIHILDNVQDESHEISRKVFTLIYESVRIPKCRQWFLDYGGVYIMMEILRSQPNRLAAQISLFLELASKYSELGQAFLKEGVLDYLHLLPGSKRKNLSTHILNNFLVHDLSIKFYTRDKLSETDKTVDGFYVHIGKKPEKCVVPKHNEDPREDVTVYIMNFVTKRRLRIPINDKDINMLEDIEEDTEQKKSKKKKRKSKKKLPCKDKLKSSSKSLDSKETTPRKLKKKLRPVKKQLKSPSPSRKESNESKGSSSTKRNLRDSTTKLASSRRHSKGKKLNSQFRNSKISSPLSPERRHSKDSKSKLESPRKSSRGSKGNLISSKRNSKVIEGSITSKRKSTKDFTKFSLLAKRSSTRNSGIGSLTPRSISNDLKKLSKILKNPKEFKRLSELSKTLSSTYRRHSSKPVSKQFSEDYMEAVKRFLKSSKNYKLTKKLAETFKKCIPTARLPQFDEPPPPVMEILMPQPPATRKYDWYLHKYLKNVEEIVAHKYSLEKKIKALAKFIAKQLSGYEKKSILPEKYYYEHHISTLKEKLSSSVIPLGYLRFGGVIERAILFKVIADRINIPCSLHRKNNIYWNEVPQLICPHKAQIIKNKLSEELNLEYMELAALTRAAGPHYRKKCKIIKRFVVDLMYDIGQLLPMHRFEANAYIMGENYVEILRKHQNMDTRVDDKFASHLERQMLQEQEDEQFDENMFECYPSCRRGDYTSDNDSV